MAYSGAKGQTQLGRPPFVVGSGQAGFWRAGPEADGSGYL